ncbi:MAG: Outer membrane efflux protein BepC [Polaribacter sp. SA4-10]|nr:MAG: Outer membrane efflux protein BepC [Polaribacter sp. SA4-10]
MKTKFILVITLLSSILIFSQKKWTLKECVDRALERNISVQQNRLNLQSAIKDVSIAKGNFLPNLNGNTGGNLNFGSGFDPVSNNRVSTSFFGGSLGVSAGYTVFNGFRNTNTYKQAQLGVESSKYDLQKMENDISLFVVRAYLDVLFAKENLSVAKVQYEISLKQIEAIKSRFEAGAIAKGEVLNTQSTAATNLQSLIAQENILNLALLNLAQTIQAPTNNFDIAILELSTPSANLLYNNSETVFEKSLINRPEIERAKLAIENADLSIEIAKSNYLPTVSASAGISTNYGYNLNLPSGFSNTDFLKQMNDNFGYGFGFNVSVPIFNRFQTRNNVAKSKINKEIFETRLESEKIQLKQTIEQAFLDVKASYKSFQAAKISLAAQKEAFKNSQQRYNFGDMTLFDFDQVRTRLVNAQGVMIRSKYDYVFKTKILQFYSGDLVLD